MRYKSFTIKNYRSIVGPLTIDIEKFPLLPIIGINESGKTTILHALFAFDFYNDKLNEGRHLIDTSNLYASSSPTPIIESEVEVSFNEITEAIDAVGKLLLSAKTQHSTGRPVIPSLIEALGSVLDVSQSVKKYKIAAKKLNQTIKLCRNLTSKGYFFENSPFDSLNGTFNNLLVRELISNLPYILYFDDFRDSVEEEIEISQENDSGWLSIIDILFQKTNKDYSVYKLPELEDRRRKNVLSDVTTTLNSTLTKEWSNFRIEDADALNIEIEYRSENSRHYVKLEVVETTSQGAKKHFYIKDRSKGFYWFFNFVMKLEFNPKLTKSTSYDAIYLLDEPGSYLHSLAQSNLAKKLEKLSHNNRVIYCTHSHYLLNPEFVPINCIHIADKKSGSCALKNIHDYEGDITQRRSAYQPVIDALEIKPSLFDFSNSNMVIVEGIIDFYSINLFKGNREIQVLPSVGASSIKYYISFMISCGKQYIALWDNDDEGIKNKNDATEFYGKVEAEKRFILLPAIKARKTIMQDLYDGKDIKLIKESLGLPENVAFSKAIAALHYSQNSQSIISSLKGKTKDNFEKLFNLLSF